MLRMASQLAARSFGGFTQGGALTDSRFALGYYRPPLSGLSVSGYRQQSLVSAAERISFMLGSGGGNDNDLELDCQRAEHGRGGLNGEPIAKKEMTKICIYAGPTRDPFSAVTPKYLVIIIASLIFICGCQNGRERIDTLKKEIQTQLPTGTSKTDVVAFLDKRKIPHGWLRISQRGPGDSWIYPDTHTEICLIHDAYGEGWLWNSVTVSVEIRFKFDASDSKLVSYSIQQIYKGL